MYYFDWDENKNRINLEKHGITFEEASTVRQATRKEEQRYVRGI